jgi:RNA polymerase sigma-70 factor (ECF subfamily)
VRTTIGAAAIVIAPHTTVRAGGDATVMPAPLDNDRGAAAPRHAGGDQLAADKTAATGRLMDPGSIGVHVNRLYRAAYGLCGSRADAEDLVQDTYERVLRQPRFLRHQDDLAYLLRVLRNAWIRTRRARPGYTIVPAGETIDDIEAPTDPIDQMLTGDAVSEALRELSEPLREAVVAVDVCGLSYREAARALGVKEGTIMSRLYRGRNQIATRIA